MFHLEMVGSDTTKRPLPSLGSEPASLFLFARPPALAHHAQIPGLAVLDRNSACTALLAVRRMLLKEKDDQGQASTKVIASAPGPA